jgi:hypothetical protein
MGNRTPLADLMVWNPVSDEQFVVDVKGWRGRGAGWFASEKKPHLNLYYIFVFVGDDRSSDQFFILAQHDLQSIYDTYRREERPNWDGRGAVLTRREAEPFAGAWQKLPGWALLQSN